MQYKKHTHTHNIFFFDAVFCRILKTIPFEDSSFSREVCCTRVQIAFWMKKKNLDYIVTNEKNKMRKNVRISEAKKIGFFFFFFECDRFRMALKRIDDPLYIYREKRR